MSAFATAGVLAVIGAASAPASGSASSAPTAPAGSAPAPSSTSSGAVSPGNETCVERVPAGKERPKLVERFPTRGLSGHAAVLEVVIDHGKGERPMPSGFRIEAGSDPARALEAHGFVLPDPEGGAGPSLDSKIEGERAKSTVRLSFVPLPKKPGRHELELPPVPITLSRASGEVVTVCTSPHPITIEDPTANVPNAEPRTNPPPRRQRELWTAAKHAAAIAAIALVVGALAAWLIGRWLRRPRPLPPPPPPRPAWEVALEELFDIRNAGLIRAERFAEHFDRVSDCVRKYLGDRYGYDGLESTTRETLSVLRAFAPRIVVLDEIERFLRQADLVKFARLTPTEAECESSLVQGEEIVRRTIPIVNIAQPRPPSFPASERGETGAPPATGVDRSGGEA